MAAAPDTTVIAETAESTVVRLRTAVANLSNQQKITMMLASAAIVALIVGSLLWSNRPEYRVLFSQISERDGGAIITSLEQLNIPYRFSEGGGAILVPSERVHETRLRLASQGLPKGGSVGFELMENQKFGVSQFSEQVNFQRALEGELARTIQSIAAVQMARVHLAIPKPSVFVREDQKPSASVLLNIYPGRTLEAAQVTGIQNLVASSVPQLSVTNVSVLDQSGALLSQLKSKLMETGLDPTQMKYVSEMEYAVIKRIEDILKPIVGGGNARVQVAADIDFSQSEQTAETHKPNATPSDSAIRSQQSSETASGSVSPPLGVPGALTNQPPVPTTAPITQPAIPSASGAAPNTPPIPGQINAAGIQAPVGNLGQPVSTRKDSTINYEVDRTIHHTKQAIGIIRRLSAAVVINHRPDTDKTGKPTTKPLSEAELKQINDLVREAMGFNKERGDTLSVANAPFTTTEPSDGMSIPLWKDREVVAMGRDLLKYLVIGLIIAYLLLKIVKPLVYALNPKLAEAEARAATGGARGAGGIGGKAGAEGAGGEGEGTEAGTSARSQYEEKLKRAKELASQDPQTAAGIISEWTGSHGG